MQAHTYASPHAKHTWWTLAVRPTCQTAVRPGTQGSRGRSRSAPPLPQAGSWFPGQRSRCTRRSPCSAAGPEGDVAAKGEGGGRSVRAVQGNELMTGGGGCQERPTGPASMRLGLKSGLLNQSLKLQLPSPRDLSQAIPRSSPLPFHLLTLLPNPLTSGLSKAIPSSRKASARPCVPSPMGLCLMLLFLAVSTG